METTQPPVPIPCPRSRQPPPPPPMADIENAGGVVGWPVRRRRAQDLLERSGSALRGGAWALSLLVCLVMPCNEHGDWMQFYAFKEYRYVAEIGLLAFIYTTLQLVRYAVRLAGGQDLPLHTGLLLDFAGDQVRLASPLLFTRALLSEG
ncbi:hypothetical protein EJB05_34854, partial [Eragrostis curvula]